MNKPLWFNGQNVTKDDMEAQTGMTETEAIERLLAVTSQRGVVNGLVLSTTVNPNEFQVTAGYGYTESGERVEFGSTQFITVTIFGSTKRLVITHSTTDGTPIAHPITGASNNTRRTNVSTLAEKDVGAVTDDDLVLCRIDSLGPLTYTESGFRQELASIIPDFFITDNMFLQSGPNTEITKHADRNNAGFYQGTGSGWSATNPHNQHIVDLDGGSEIYNFATYHQQRMHHGGIVGDAGALVPSASGVTLTLTSPIPAGTYLHVNGEILTSLPVYSTTAFGAVTGIEEFWLACLNSTGAFVLTKRATWTQTISNCWISWISSGTSPGAKNLVWTLATNSLSWDGGPSVEIEDFGGRYRLMAADGINYIEVEITNTIPVTGPTLTDVVTVIGSPTINLSTLLTENAFICTVCRNGAGSLISASVRDYRSLGTLGFRELSNRAFNYDIEQPSTKVPEMQPLAELMSGFVVSGFGASISGNLNINGGVCWVNGRRLTVANSSFAASPVGTYYVFVDRLGTVSIDTDDLRGKPGQERDYLLLHIAESNGAWTSVQDQRNFASRGWWTHPVLSNGCIGGPPTFAYGLNVSSGGVVTLPSGPDTLVGQVVYGDNLDPGLLTTIEGTKKFVSAFDALWGDGSDGVWDTAVDGVDLSAKRSWQFTNLTIRTGHVLVGGGPYLFIAVSGTLTIEGTGKISLVGVPGGAAVSASPTGGIGRGGDGGSGGYYFGTSAVNNGGNGTAAGNLMAADGGVGVGTGGPGGTGTSMLFVNLAGGGGGGGGNFSSGFGGGGGGAGGGGNGGNGGVAGGGATAGSVGGDGVPGGTLNNGSLSNAELFGWWFFCTTGRIFGWGGGGGGGGGYNATSVTYGGGGGGGGGALYVEARNISMSPSGLIDCSGGDGGGSANINYSSGGGGGGGTAFVVAENWLTAINLALVDITGGAGGVTPPAGGGRSGAAGGSGFKMLVDLSTIPEV